MSTKKREVIWGGWIMGAKMRRNGSPCEARRPPARLIVPTQKASQPPEVFLVGAART